MSFQFRGDEISRRQRPSGLKFTIFACSKHGKCTEGDVGQKLADGSPMAVCKTCPLLGECRVGKERPEKTVRHQTAVSHIGDNLKVIIEAKVGAIPCGECKAEIRRLNTRTAAEVLAERDALAERIAERAQTKSPKWWQRWGAMLAPGLAKSMVLDWIDEAVAGEQVNEPAGI